MLKGVPDAILQIFAQVSAALLLGAFFGLERRMRGYPDASLFHAAIAAAGLVVMVAMRPQSIPLVTLMAISVGVTFAVVAAGRAALQWCAGSPQAVFAQSGSDTFTISGALCAGCACGTGDVRSIAAVLLGMIVVSIFRPLDRRAAEGLSRGDVDAIHGPSVSPLDPAGLAVAPFAANDDAPLSPAVQQDEEPARYNDPLGR